MVRGAKVRTCEGAMVRLLVFSVFMAAGTSLIAHHSFAMYDMQKSQSMTGKLTRFIPGGNHAQLVFEVLGDDGKPMMKNGKVVVWGVETGSAANIARNGITVESFPVGTVIGDAAPASRWPSVRRCRWSHRALRRHDARGRLQREDRQSVRRAGELGGSFAEHVPPVQVSRRPARARRLARAGAKRSAHRARPLTRPEP